MLFTEIDRLNEVEQSQYGNKDLQEMGGYSGIVNQEVIVEQTDKLNKIIATAATKRISRKATTLKEKLNAHQSSIEKYEHQQQLSGTRSGYSVTDTDATAMKMENEEILPAYKVLIGSEG